jgi:hypothetical protein
MAILEGTYRGELRGWLFGVALSAAGMLGLGWNRSSLEMRNGIARRFVLPPEPQANLAAAIVGGLMILLGALAVWLRDTNTNGPLVFGLVMIALGAIFLVGAIVENSSLGRRQSAWRHQLDEMHGAWICLRCGNQWSMPAKQG